LTDTLTPPTPKVDDRQFTVAARSQSRTILRRFRRHVPAMIASGVMLVLTLFVVIAPRFSKWSVTERDRNALSKPPSSEHLFGTDGLGNDVYAAVLQATQRSLQIALIAALLVTLIGVTIGAIAGYYRGWIDSILMRFTDLVLTIPLLVAVAVVSVGFPDAPWWVIPVILGLFSWIGLARIVRAEFLSLREKEFVEAARAVGATDRRIIFRHILPSLTGPIIVAATLAIAGAILTEAFLSFLGAGVRRPDVSLGLLLNEGDEAFTTRPWLFWFPAIVIVVISLCVNFIGDGLRDAFDPKQNRVKA
jgi:peptide/nickel transport system permease protein